MATSPLLLALRGASIEVHAVSGGVTVRAESRSDAAVVRGQERVAATWDEDGGLTLTAGRGGSDSLELLVPEGTSITVGNVSGAIELSGRLGAARVTGVSGRVEIEHVEFADVRTTSGPVHVANCDGVCRVQTRSSKATIDRCGRLDAFTASGSVSVDRASGPVIVRSTSGRVEVGGEGREDIAVQTMSGSVKVRLPKGVRPAPFLSTVSGHSVCACEPGEDCRVAVDSMSGKIEVVPG